MPLALIFTHAIWQVDTIWARPTNPLKYRPDVLWLPFSQVCSTRCCWVHGLPWICLSWILYPALRSWLQSLPADVWLYCPEVPKSSPRNWTKDTMRQNKTISGRGPVACTAALVYHLRRRVTWIIGDCNATSYFSLQASKHSNKTKLLITNCNFSLFNPWTKSTMCIWYGILPYKCSKELSPK